MKNRLEIENYIASKGWGFKFRNGEFCLDLCPLSGCGPGHFYINGLKETFYCHKCGERGHFLSLKKRLGDLPAISHVSVYSKPSTSPKIIDLSVVEQYHKALLNNPIALSYLTEERAFTLETINKFKIGFKDGSISIPYFRGGECLNFKFRSLGVEKKFFREEGAPSILFNLDNALKYQGSVIVTEGEFDAMAFDEMGFSNVVSVPNGAESFSDTWIDELEQFDQIYLSYDMDEAGRRGVEKIAEKLGRYRCLNVLLPLKDANDCLRAGFKLEEMSLLLAQAKRFESPLIKSSDHFFDEIRALHSGKAESKGLSTGWHDFDNLLQGIRPTELTVLTGETACGKSTWGANLAFRLAKETYPVLIFSSEMKPKVILRKMISMETGTPLNQLTKAELEEALQYLSTLPVFFVDVYGELGLGELKDSIHYASRRYGIELVIIDHLHFFLKYSADNERQAIDQALKNIKSWAMDLGIHIVLVVHPTKLTYDNKVVHLNDLKGSSGLKQIPDNVLSIWRPRGEDSTKTPVNEIILYILKVRCDTADEGKLILSFDKRSQSYSDSRPGLARPAEGRGSPELPSPSPRSFSGKDYASGLNR